MTTAATIFLIVIAAAAAMLLVATLVWIAGNKRKQRRHREADKVREAARQEKLQVKRQEALAAATAANGRAAPAKADVTAAQASGLQ
jgi:Flp pilus assembly protein TadB